MQYHRDRIAFITGGATEQGLEIACALGEAGAAIVLADTGGERLQAAGQVLRDKGINVLPLPVDVADRTAMRRAAEAAIDHFGKVHMLIAAGFRGSQSRLADMGKVEWDHLFAVNVGGIVNLLQELLPVILQQGEGGHILACLPVSGIVGGSSDGAKAAHASAVVALMESLFGELRDQMVGVSLLITADRQNLGGRSGEEGARTHSIGVQAVNGMAQGDFYIVADNVSADEIQAYFARLLAAMPQTAGDGGGAPGDPAAMFPTYAAVLRAKGAKMSHA